MKTRLAWVIFGAILLAQVTLPTAAMFRPTPAHFGWQMFSFVSSYPEFVVTYESGATERFLEEDLAKGVRRGDIDFVGPAVARLCEGPAVVSVLVERGGEQEVTQCH